LVSVAVDGASQERRPLTGDAVALGGLWRTVEVVQRTGSTNADLIARARDGAPEGLVLAAEEQTAGRGRIGRSWVSPPRSALMFSLLVRPGVPSARLGWLPLLTGLAVATAVREVTAVDAVLKWPNDVVTSGGKLAGILAEAAGDAVVVGTGLNVSTLAEELPSEGQGSLAPTSLLLSGAHVLDRELLLASILAAFERRYIAWRDAAGDPAVIRPEYLGLCDTVGRQVRVELPSGQLLSGEAAGVDSDGRLVVRPPASAPPPAGESPAPAAGVAVAAGDVVHVR
jgi:BirA family biotin operon repressor/biotin-[acetyl-CoA-carboxylase] ligase